MTSPTPEEVRALIEQMHANAVTREMGRDPDAVEARNVYADHALSFDWKAARDALEAVEAERARRPAFCEKHRDDSLPENVSTCWACAFGEEHERAEKAEAQRDALAATLRHIQIYGIGGGQQKDEDHIRRVALAVLAEHGLEKS